MKVILLKNIPKVGKKFEIVNVAEGFALNSLFPQNLAEHASPKAIQRAEQFKAEEEKARNLAEENLMKSMKRISEVSIVMQGKANEKGHLFASISKEEISEALKSQADMAIESEYIVLDRPIKELGDHKVEVKVQDKTAEFQVKIEAVE